MRSAMLKSFRFVFLTLITLIFCNTSFSQSSEERAYLLKINGDIGPATFEYLQNGFESAQTHQASLILLEINTPGGLIESTRDINQLILNSSIPVVAYVSPSGARAASAGVYILYASHFAAMAPGTNVGSATPVNISESSSPANDQTVSTKHSTQELKMLEDSRAYLRSLAQLRKRNLPWAEETIKKSASISAEEALKMNVINFIAKNETDLLNQLNNRSVLINDKLVVLKTTTIKSVEYSMNWRTRFLQMITNPNIAYILMLIGIYGIFFELFSPGFVLPGVLGSLCLLTALYAFHLLPVNYTGAGLILLGIGFIIAEALTPSFGILGFGGFIAFVLGSIMLFNNFPDEAVVHWPLIIAAGLATSMVLFTIVNLFIRSKRRKSAVGTETLLHQTGVALKDFKHEGQVKIAGEIWQAHSKTPISAGEKVKVIAIKGLLIEVEPSIKRS